MNPMINSLRNTKALILDFDGVLSFWEIYADYKSKNLICFDFKYGLGINLIKK